MSIELEILRGRRAFPKAQQLLHGPTLRTVGQIDVGWHGTNVSGETGAFALVKMNGAHTDLVGDILSIESGLRKVYVYCLGSADLPVELSVTRRAFASLGLLAIESLPCIVKVIS